MQKVADSINQHVKQSKFKDSYSEIMLKAKELKNKDRILINEITLKCEQKRKNVALYLFNDLFIHLSETKAKNKSNLSHKRYHWPLELIWIKERGDFTKITGPCDSYRFRTSEISPFLSCLQKAISDRLSSLEMPENIVLSSSIRYASYDFQKTNSSFTGKWKNGKVRVTIILFTSYPCCTKKKK